MMGKDSPIERNSPQDRHWARMTRNAQWSFMERVQKQEIATGGPLWWCIWNKYGRKEEEDEMRTCLLSGFEIKDWTLAHPDWFEIGEWNEECYAAPVRLTDAGRAALANRAPYEMEPVLSGMMSPGFITVPADPEMLNEKLESEA